MLHLDAEHASPPLEGEGAEFVEATSAEVCAGCGVAGHAEARLKWKIEDRWGGDPDLYCNVCYWAFRKTEFAEEAVIGAINLAKIGQQFTTQEIRRAMDDLGSLTPEAFADALEKGNASLLEPRSEEELTDAYGHSGVGSRVGWSAKGRHVA